MTCINTFFVIAVVALFGTSHEGLLKNPLKTPPGKWYFVYNHFMTAEYVKHYLAVNVMNMIPCQVKESKLIPICRLGNHGEVTEVITIKFFKNSVKDVSYGMCFEISLDKISQFEHYLLQENYMSGRYVATKLDGSALGTVNAFIPEKADKCPNNAEPSVGKKYLRDMICSAKEVCLPPVAIEYLMTQIKYKPDDNLPLDYCEPKDVQFQFDDDDDDY